MLKKIIYFFIAFCSQTLFQNGGAKVLLFFTNARYLLKKAINIFT
jgi:hypothetical protein